MPKTITLLGSTGSIGTQSLDVARMHGYRIFGLAANSRVEILQKQIEEFHPEYVAVVDPAACEKLDAALAGTANAPKLLKGPEGLRTLAAMDGPDVVLNAVVGIAGLPASLAAIESGHDLALANKESLVTGGHLVTDAVKKYGVKLLPVDSEHSAIFQCLQGCADRREIRRLILTCSGGPFRGMGRDEVGRMTKADALRHPNWTMGPKITVDCSTLMNKGLEVIEAMRLYELPLEKVTAVIHRQSVVHSLVEFVDGAVLAQLGGHKNLGIHTEMFADGVLPLVESGVINGEAKNIDKGKMVSTFLMGSQRVYDFIDDNPAVLMMDVGYTNDPYIISKNDRVTAINSALQVDITGQVCADSLGTKFYSGVGGQIDFVYGASLSKGGKAIIAMPSVTNKGISKIAPVLSPGAGVVTTRNHIHWFVTEHGAVDLYGKTLQERARLIISVADPSAQEELDRAAFERFGQHHHYVKGYMKK